MGKLLKILFSRAFTTGILIALQVILTITILLWLSNASIYVYIVFYLISICFVVYMFSSDQAIEYKLIWSVVIMLFPLLGGLFYLLWGKRSTDWRDRKSVV